jgi:hypothetical protein
MCSGLTEQSVEVVEIWHRVFAAWSGQRGRGQNQGVDVERPQGVEAGGYGFEVGLG